MSSGEEAEPLGDLPILINDLKIYKYENNIEEAVDSILYYLKSDQGRQELELYKSSDSDYQSLAKELNVLTAYFQTQLLINEEFGLLSEFAQIEPFSEGEDRATALINMGCYYSCINEDLESFECFEEAQEILDSYVNSDVKSTENIVALAICYNNKATLDIKKCNYESAYKTCKK